jgi:hypothetical protein
MAAFSSFDRRTPGHVRDGISFAALLALAVASALTGAVVALVAQRVLRRYQYIEVLPQPKPLRHLREPGPAASAPPESASVAPDLAELTTSPLDQLPGARTPLPGEASVGLSHARVAELGALVETDDDTVAGDGSLDCPDGFPIKGNGRSGIYHWPGANAYSHTRPTLCFRSVEAAERGGFRPAKR